MKNSIIHQNIKLLIEIKVRRNTSKIPTEDKQ